MSLNGCKRALPILFSSKKTLCFAVEGGLSNMSLCLYCTLTPLAGPSCGAHLGFLAKYCVLEAQCERN